MSAIDAITKSNAGTGQAAGKTGVVASGSFEMLFAISTERAVLDTEVAPDVGDLVAADIQPSEEVNADADADLDVILSFPPIVLPEVTAPVEVDAPELATVAADTDFGAPATPDLPMVPVALGLNTDVLLPQTAVGPLPEISIEDVSVGGHAPLPQLAPALPMPAANPEAEAVLADPPAVLPDIAALGIPADEPPIDLLPPTAGRAAELPAVETGPAHATAAQASDPRSPDELVTQVKTLDGTTEKAAPTRVKKDEGPAPARIGPVIDLAADAPPTDMPQNRGQIVARIQIPTDVDTSAQALTPKAVIPSADAQIASAPSEADLPDLVSEQPGATLLLSKGQPAPALPQQMSRAPAAPEMSGAVPPAPLSTVPAAELLRATLDTRDAAWRERMVTQLLGDGRAGTQSLTLTLRPKSLGDIQLSVDVGAGETTVRIVAETSAAVRLIMANEDLLSNLMEQAGVRLAGLSVQHMAGSGAMAQSIGQVVGQASGSATARDASNIRKDRARGADHGRLAPDTSLKLGDGSQLGINLMA